MKITIKGLLAILIVSLAVTSCRNYPDDDLTYHPIVITNHDPNVNFSNFQTYSLPTSVRLIEDDPDDTLLRDDVAQSILSAIETNMNNRGYTKVAPTASPDLGIGVLVIAVTTSVVIYPGYWYGYYDPWYGYGGYYPYYPYASSYDYTTGTLILEMADFMNVDSTQEILTIPWLNVNSGILQDPVTNKVDAVNSVNQAFTQSPYITTN